MDWASVYSARTLTLPDYRAGRVLFTGDAAHLLPIFGVRGANTAFQDSQSLGWHLAYVVKGLARTRTRIRCSMPPVTTTRSSQPVLAAVRMSAVGTASAEGADQCFADADGHFRSRYGVGSTGAAYLLRPDQHVCGRWLTLDATRLRAAFAAALPRQTGSST